MRLEGIRSLTRATPFAPFRVFLTNGETYDVWHPDMIVATLGALFIVTGGAMIVLGFLGYRQTARRLPPSVSGCAPTWALGLLSLVLLTGTVLGLVLAVRGY